MSLSTALSGDTHVRAKADGTATHQATLAVTLMSGEGSPQARFTLPQSGAAQFQERAGQSVSPDGKTLIANIAVAHPVTVYFTDSNTDGEMITLQASTTTDGVTYAPSTPPKLDFQFTSTNSSLLIGGTVELFLSGGRYATTYWCPGNSELVGACVTLDGNVDPGSPRTQFTMKVVSENEVTFSFQGTSVYKYQPDFGLEPESYWVLALGDRAPTVFVVKNYDPAAGTFQLWDPDTNFACAGMALSDGTAVVALVPDSAGDTYSITYETTSSGPTPGSAYTLLLEGDDKRMPQANGTTPHTAVATVEQNGAAVSKFATPVTFNLPDSQGALFVEQTGQSTSADRKKLSAPVDPVTGTATAVFVDTNGKGESVALRAELDMEPLYVLSTPESLPFGFAPNLNAYLNLKPQATSVLHRAKATVTAGNISLLPTDKQVVTFTLPADNGVIFVAGNDQSLDAGAKTLTAPLTGTAAAAEMLDLGVGTLFAVQAAIDNDSIYVPASPPYLVFAIDAKLKLAGDNITKIVAADGVTQHMAQATVLGKLGTRPGNVPFDVTFKLPSSKKATFVPQDGQTLKDGGTTLVAPLDSGTKAAYAYFVDTNAAGETVALTAEIIDNGFNLLSDPPSLDFPFTALTLSLQPASDDNSVVPADGISPHRATASLPQNATDVGTDRSVKFTLPSGKHATFQPQAGQSVSTDGLTLSAPLDDQTHEAQAWFVDTQIAGGESVELSARIDALGLSSTPASLSFAFQGLTLSLPDDNLGYVPADNASAHMATVTLSGPGTSQNNYPWSVVFTLASQSAKFQAQPGQTLNTNGTLTAPLIDNTAQALFVDNDYRRGETVTLSAEIQNDLIDLPSTPASRRYQFGALELDLTSPDAGDGREADGKATHTATVTLMMHSDSGLVPYASSSNVTYSVHFELPSNQTATFKPQTGATLSDNGHALDVPLSGNSATASFVDTTEESVGLTATLVSSKAGINLPSTPPSMDFVFGTYTGALGTYDHPKHFSDNLTVDTGDVFQLKDEYTGEGYIVGAFYIALKAQADSSVNPPPPFGSTDPNGFWKHAWQSCIHPGLYPEDNTGTERPVVLIYGNGRHGAGISVYFAPADSSLQQLIPTSASLPSYALFASYMDKVLSKLNPTLVNFNNTALTGGWSSSPTPPAYTTPITAPQEEIGNGSSSNTVTVGPYHVNVYLTCSQTNGAQATIGARLGLPDGSVAQFGTVYTNSTPAPVQATAYPSTTYTVLNSLVIQSKTALRSGASGDARNDMYCLDNADTNILAPEFYWRQDNYIISIDNAKLVNNGINSYGHAKHIADWTWGKDTFKDGSVPSNPFYYRSAYNYYCTDAYIVSSSARSMSVNVWDNYQTSLDDLGGQNNALTLVLVTYINITAPFMQQGRTYDPFSDGDLSGTTFHDQYGNEGHFYFNFNFPSTYYPPGYDPDAPDYGISPDSNSIKPISLGDNLLSAFTDIVQDSAASGPGIPQQDYAYWYMPYVQKWVVATRFPLFYYGSATLAAQGLTGWAFGPSLGVQPARVVPNGALGLYTGKLEQQPAWSDPGTWVLGISQTEGGGPRADVTNTTVIVDQHAGTYTYLRPLWTQNSFRLWHQGAYANDNLYIYSNDPNDSTLWYALQAPPKKGAQEFTIKFVQTTNGS
ncbi:hypothetical protein WKR88_16275 [Trinickia caryophylli]|uniref:Uncharacterized protein n=1 Tax=Trinickia caryophylli TaxID=28094 RepID=A0A1X7FQK1_TRICW|nr:hypothetical protein [Trinickia caryophylli]TRX14450.1 hypothetical protein FNF07_24580 [Trinickia caryophylli]WQE14287.1 hypothetical protein U0034_26770 [Trinickia caryophylli]GLU33199.1 hypothetical protein Busp01_30410 [Trinickia caryophylli]SMF56503.1 hypothetical protein SAMN06295900_110154 [Trinickia caryophylli]